MPRLNALSSFQIGYIMGLVVGEGSFTGDRRQPALQVKLHEADPEPLFLLQHLLGGHVFGPYEHNRRHYCVYMLRGRALRAAIPLFERHLPDSRRRRQFEAWLQQRSRFFDAVTPSPPPQP